MEDYIYSLYSFFPGLDGTPLPPPPAQSCVSSAGQLFKTVYTGKKRKISSPCDSQPGPPQEKHQMIDARWTGYHGCTPSLTAKQGK